MGFSWKCFPEVLWCFSWKAGAPNWDFLHTGPTKHWVCTYRALNTWVISLITLIYNINGFNATGVWDTHILMTGNNPSKYGSTFDVKGAKVWPKHAFWQASTLELLCKQTYVTIQNVREVCVVFIGVPSRRYRQDLCFEIFLCCDLKWPYLWKFSCWCMFCWSYYNQMVLMNMCMHCEQFLIESTVSSRCWKGSQTLFYQALKCTFAALYERVLYLLLWKFAGVFVQASSWYTTRLLGTYGNTHLRGSVWDLKESQNPKYRSIPIMHTTVAPPASKWY